MSDFLSSDGHKILLAFWMTLKVSALSAAGSLVLGTVLAAMRVAPLPVLRTVGTLYVNVLRNTPLTLIILFCGLGLGSIITVADVQTTNYFWLAVIGLVAYTSAFVCEVLRSGVNTVPLGQAEAARSIGLSFTQTLRIVVLPQAFRAVIAPLGSVLIALIKNTTIAAAIGVPEAFYTMRNELQSHGDIVIPAVLAMAFGIAFVIARISSHWWIRLPAGTVVEFFRAIPLLLLIFFASYAPGALTNFTWNPTALQAVVFGLTMYNGSVLAEVIRAGINAIPKGQSEAGYAVGLRKGQLMRLVLVLQAITAMMPAIVSQLVVLLKDPALGTIIAYDNL